MPIQESYEKTLRQAVESAPYYQLLHLTLERIDMGFARLRMPFRSELTQVYGFIHGGAIGSVADTAAAFALMTLVDHPGEKVTTVEFKINYLRSVGAGEMFAEARVIHKGKRLATVDMEVKNGNGNLLAKGLTTYMILSSPKIGES